MLVLALVQVPALVQVQALVPARATPWAACRLSRCGE